MKDRYAGLTILFLFVLVVIISVLTGSVNIPASELFKGGLCGILKLRLSRVMLAGVAGASLAVVGVILQGLLKNPLADPFVLGISSGTGLGAVLAIVVGFGTFDVGVLVLPFFGFLGGIITIFFVYILSKKGSRVGIEDLLLSGVIVSAILSSFIMFIVSIIETENLHSAIWWLLGNTQIFDIRLLFAVSLLSAIGIMASFLLARPLNIMSLGEEEAITMGLDVERIKLIFFIISSLITAAVVSACGLIGFVGLVVPHIARRIVGPDHRNLIPFSAICGATFLIFCDIVARRIIAPSELSIGVVTAIVGGPFFIFLLKRARKPG